MASRYSPVLPSCALWRAGVHPLRKAAAPTPRIPKGRYAIAGTVTTGRLASYRSSSTLFHVGPFLPGLTNKKHLGDSILLFTVAPRLLLLLGTSLATLLLGCTGGLSSGRHSLDCIGRADHRLLA